MPVQTSQSGPSPTRPESPTDSIDQAPSAVGLILRRIRILATGTPPIPTPTRSGHQIISLTPMLSPTRPLAPQLTRVSERNVIHMSEYADDLMQQVQSLEIVPKVGFDPRMIRRRGRGLEYHYPEQPGRTSACKLCGPPFIDFVPIHSLQGQTGCTWLCAKRYVSENLACPDGIMASQTNGNTLSC